MRLRIFLLLILFAQGSVAANEGVVGMDERVLRAVDVIQKSIDAEAYDQALEQISELENRRLSSYERAQVMNLKGYVYWETDNIAAARAAYVEGLAQEELPDSLRGNFLGTLGRIALLDENYPDAERYITELLGIERQNTPENRVLLANVYLGQERFRDALQPLRSAIDEKRTAGSQPQESWLSMLASVYYSLDDFEAMRSVIRELVETYPREQYLMNLAALHGQLGDQQRQLALIEALLQEDRVSQASNLRMLASLYLSENLPYKAAKLLETELERGRVEADQRTLEQLSQAWYLASEIDRAIPPLERAAALADDGTLYMRVARLYLDNYQWREADRAAKAAIDKGGLDAEGNAWLLRGMAQARLEAFAEAESAFNRALGFSDTRLYAEQWLAYLESERARAEALTPQS